MVGIGFLVVLLLNLYSFIGIKMFVKMYKYDGDYDSYCFGGKRELRSLSFCFVFKRWLTRSHFSTDGREQSWVFVGRLFRNYSFSFWGW